jgi:hypothetical protein
VFLRTPHDVIVMSMQAHMLSENAPSQRSKVFGVDALGRRCATDRPWGTDQTTERKISVPRGKATTTKNAGTSEGRAATRAINDYLLYLETSKPRRGRKRDPERIRMQIESLNQKLAETHGVRKVSLLQKRIELQEELARLTMATDGEAYEANFIKHAADYSKRRKIGWNAWIEAGVPPAVLKAAGITE